MQPLHSMHHPDTPCGSGEKATIIQDQFRPALEAAVNALYCEPFDYPAASVRRHCLIPSARLASLWCLGRFQQLSGEELALDVDEHLFVHATTLFGSSCWVQVRAVDLCACSLESLTQHIMIVLP